MTWQPERGWLSLGARAATAALGGVVLAVGLTSGPGPLMLALPEKAVEVKPQPATAGGSPILIEQEQGTAEPTRPAARRASIRVAPGTPAAPPVPEPSHGHEQLQAPVAPPSSPVPTTQDVVPRDDSSDGDVPDDSDRSGTGSDDDESGNSGPGSDEDDPDEGGSGPG